MQKRLLFDGRLLQFTINRLCQQLIENHGDFANSVLMGLQPRGIFLAERIRTSLESLLNKKILLGYLDTTFHRDDFRRRDGRPEKVELLTLIDRMYSRDIPVEATYVGRRVNTVRSQRILVELKEQGMPEDNIWIMEKEDEA